MNHLISKEGQTGVSGKSNLEMKLTPTLALLAILTLIGPGVASASVAEDDGIALAIIYDTSGSMRDPVPDQAGRSSPKYLIANRALICVAREIQAFTTNTSAGSTRKIDAGLFIFEGDHAREVIKFGPYDEAALENWAGNFSNPRGNTPLGNALTAASRVVLDSPLPRKHVLVITDGMNTAGPGPEVVLPKLQQRARQHPGTFSVHFIAFDVDAKQFSPLKKRGATVVGAADEKQLNSQLDFILQRKILLEEEDPPNVKAK